MRCITEARVTGRISIRCGYTRRIYLPKYRYRNTYRITEILTKIPTFLVHDTFSTQVSRLGSFESCFIHFILCCSDFWPIVFLTMHFPLSINVASPEISSPPSAYLPYVSQTTTDFTLRKKKSRLSCQTRTA